MKTRPLRRVLGVVALPGTVLCAAAAGCEPQDIYLFDEPAGAAEVRAPDAGSEEPELPAPDPDPDDDAPMRMQPACETQTCAQCVVNDLCSVESTTLYCHPVTGDCRVPCDPEAAADQRACPLDEQCAASGLCVDCVLDSDCSDGANPVCHSERGVCVQCLSPADCPVERPVCDEQAFRCLECLDDGDCAATGEVCLPGAQRCVGCRDDADCRSLDDANRCLPDELRCVECIDDDDCAGDPDKPFCKLSEHECDDDRN